MFILWTLLKLSALVVFCLWAYGRYQRCLVWTSEPEVRFERAYGTAPSTTAVLVFTGAFNGPAHTREMVTDHWSYVGDTFIIDYPLRRFNLFRTMLAGYRCIAPRSRRDKYEEIILVGYSLGGLICLHLLRYTCLHNPVLAKKMKLLFADTPLYAEHLRIPGGAAVPPGLMKLWLAVARFLRFIHLGPLSNRLSGLVAKATFIPAPAEMCDPHMNKATFQEHMSFLQNNQLSLMSEQIAAIAGQGHFKRSEFGDDTPVYYLQCGDGSQPDVRICAKGEALLDGHGMERHNKKGELLVAKRRTVVNNLDAPDKVIMGDASARSLRALFPNMGHAYVGDKTMHVALLEGGVAWHRATKMGTDALR